MSGYLSITGIARVKFKTLQTIINDSLMDKNLTIIKNSNENLANTKVLVSFSPFAIWAPHFEIELELIQSHIYSGGKAIMLKCNGDLPICEPNPNHDLIICSMCKSRFKAGVRWLKGPNFTSLSFYSLTLEQKSIVKRIASHKWDTFTELRDFVLDNADIGLSAASSIISFLREPEPDVTLHQTIVKKHLETALTVYFSIQNQLINQKANKLIIFNGRFSALRPALRSAQSIGVSCEVHERASDISRYSIFKNTYPHNLQAVKEQMNEVYSNTSMSEKAQRELAFRWFDERRNGLDQGWPSLIKNQKLHHIPESLKRDRINIVIFISSDDEFMACTEWDNPYYFDQNKAIEELLKDLNDDNRLRIYVRVHPILKGVINTQTKKLTELAEKYPELILIPAESPVHSYSLIDAADVVITYGSTVGIEASYSGKLSILMGRALYDELDVCIQPKSHIELIELIKQIASGKSLELPQNRELGLIKFGLFNCIWGKSFNYLKPTGLYSAEMVRNGKTYIIKANLAIRLINKVNDYFKSLDKFSLTQMTNNVQKKAR